MFALFAKAYKKYRLEDNIVKIGSHVGMSGKEMPLWFCKRSSILRGGYIYVLYGSASKIRGGKKSKN